MITESVDTEQKKMGQSSRGHNSWRGLLKIKYLKKICCLEFAIEIIMTECSHRKTINIVQGQHKELSIPTGKGKRIQFKVSTSLKIINLPLTITGCKSWHLVGFYL